MRTAKDFRDLEKAFSDLASAAGKCAELEEHEDSSNSEKEEALKNFMFAMAKMQMM